jgi:outer membrane protein TolC
MLRRRVTAWLLVGLQIVCGGCQTGRKLMQDPWAPVIPLDGSLVRTAPIESPPPADVSSAAPRTVRNEAPAEVWDMRLDEALQYALAHGKVMVDSGGRVLQAPFAVQTVYDPAIRETDPLGGPMAALSSFDAQFSSTTFYRQGNTFNNNLLLGGGTYFLNSSQLISDNAISKRAATGGTFRLGTNTEYFSSDAPYNYFNSLTSTAVQGEIRQPLLRGAGVEFNRIAGAYPIAGAFNGIVIGRINTDISLLDFEASVRTVLIDVERAYWDLALAYRDLEAKIAARDATLETWRIVHKKLQVGMLGADEEGEARAREQYYLLQAQVENAYSGAPPVSAALGSSVGNAVLGNAAGVLGNERRLRLLLGLPPTDNRLIRPSTEPAHALVSFDWNASVVDAMSRRVELRRQTLSIKRREAELVATRNLRLPQLDAIAGAGYRGYSNDYSLIVDPAGANRSNNFNNTTYNVGLNLTMPLGNRLATTAIRNAELQLARERAVLDEQRLHVIHELSNTIVELDRAFAVMGTNYNRRAAAQQQKVAVARKYETGAVGLEQVLDSQRRWADAEAGYHRAVVDYNRAIAEVHLTRGTLLDYDGVRLAESLNLKDEKGRFDFEFRKETTIDYKFSELMRAKAPAAGDDVEAVPNIMPLPPTETEATAPLDGRVPGEPTLAPVPTMRTATTPAPNAPIRMMPVTIPPDGAYLQPPPPRTDRQQPVAAPGAVPVVAPNSGAAIVPDNGRNLGPAFGTNPPSTQPLAQPFVAQSFVVQQPAGPPIYVQMMPGIAAPPPTGVMAQPPVVQQAPVVASQGPFLLPPGSVIIQQAPLAQSQPLLSPTPFPQSAPVVTKPPTQVPDVQYAPAPSPTVVELSAPEASLSGRPMIERPTPPIPLIARSANVLRPQQAPAGTTPRTASAIRPAPKPRIAPVASDSERLDTTAPCAYRDIFGPPPLD